MSKLGMGGGEREDNRCASRVVNARVSFLSSSGGAVLCNAAAYAPSQGCVCPVVSRVGIPGLASLGASGSPLGPLGSRSVGEGCR